ncbi:meiotically up-regulated gene 56 protein [Massarina eburnea CBS 473.64]|uniref:Meiotically up-regulated gene 56 protein n=1 Tax=Massarina eburnea CBS 473.64 TaxID=1395130 RepID=A0A6A6RK91_9PLEO|nr:meiotically up-regulated gene 56 protein [Massarina eburnea CBS 473.64]
MRPDIANLHPDSYTAQRLQHATPEHIHLTSRRFFIGPIPEAWLKTHRRDWYKNHLHINYSSRTATFSSTDSRGAKQRRLTGLEGPSSSALFQTSFPQPEDVAVEEEGEERQNGEAARGEAEEVAAPVEVPLEVAQEEHVDIPGDEDEFVDADSEPEEDLHVYTHQEIADSSNADAPEPSTTRPQKHRRKSSTKTYVTAYSSREGLGHNKTGETGTNNGASEAVASAEQQQGTDQGREQVQASSLPVPRVQEEGTLKMLGKRPLSNIESMVGTPTSTMSAQSADAASTTSLLRKADSNKAPAQVDHPPPSRGILTRIKRQSEMDFEVGSPLGRGGEPITRKKSNLRNLVKFDIPEDSKRASMHLRAKQAQMTVQRASSKLKRRKIKDGLVVKMERMLVRVDAAAVSVPDDFDENAGQKIDSRVKDKWREYMVVCRHSSTEDAEFVLQMYKTRVIPEIEEPNAGKRAAYEIPLGRKIAKVNLYSSLDKSVVVWLPAGRGTHMFIMQARTASNAVEWYTFLRNILGWRRASELQVNIPDMSVSLHIADPFQRLEASQNAAQEASESDNEEAIMKTMREEQAVAESLIRKCMGELQDSSEWADVLDSWVNNQRIGLAWKRYDRLEWIHGSNERKMYGTIAMAKSHELELRPKSHYPTTAVTRKKKKTLTEPSPVEGFLIRLTSQRGQARRLGLMFHKQLYFATHDQYLVFSRPTNATPPPPPKLIVSDGSAMPSPRTFGQKVPDTWAVDPYPIKDNRIEWLTEGNTDASSTSLHDECAAEEAERKAQNLLHCDGYINLASVVKVRKAKKGATPADDDIESGSDVDFDEIHEGSRDDGVTKDLDMERTFELVMKNGLIIRLQSADKARRKEWIKHLRALTKYWRHRTASDITLYKSTRARNLTALNIDEEAEAYVGQFAKKWEVTQSYASPLLYNMCGIAHCRSIHMSGMLYRKPRVHAPFTRCSVMLAAGTLLVFQDVLRSRTGKQLNHIHHERIANLDLKDCYIYSGLLTESDLLYQNQTFDSNKPGHHALPRIFLDDGWTSTDEDVMTTFVVWHGKSKSWFRTQEGAGGGESARQMGKRGKLKRVAKLGSKGRSLVFRARSRAERDHWVLGIQGEIERCGGLSAADDVRIEERGKGGACAGVGKGARSATGASLASAATDGAAERAV